MAPTPIRRLRHPALLLLTAVFAACAPAPRLTPHGAGELAARLANDRCQARYGARPFAPSDYEAEWIGGRWTWGGDEEQPVDGFSASVSFAPDGGDHRVDVNRGEQRGNPEGL